MISYDQSLIAFPDPSHCDMCAGELPRQCGTCYLYGERIAVCSEACYAQLCRVWKPRWRVRLTEYHVLGFLAAVVLIYLLGG